MFTGSHLKVFLEIFKLFFFNTTFFQQILHLSFIKHNRCRTFLLLLFYNLLKIFMNILHNLKVSLFTKCLINKWCKCFLLLLCRKRNRTVKQAVDKPVLKLTDIFSIEKCHILICTSLIKCREQKSHIRYIYHMILLLIVEIIVLLIIPKPRLRKIHMTYTA